MTRALLLCCLLTVGCGWRPVRFADRAPVTIVHDDRPISIPVKRTFIEELYEADVYVRREIVNGLDPRDYPEALDVSSFDDVPQSSWYRGILNEQHPLIDYRGAGPPKPPFTVIDEPPQSGMPDATVIEDARGLRYELQPDIPERDGMRTGASAIASRLVHTLGYYTPPVFIVRSHTGERVAAMRWPLDVDLGPTPIVELRPDDPNDQLPHVDRRSLRVMKLVTAWLGITKLRPRMLRDAFVGKNAEGHVRHYLVGFDGSLGVEDYLRAVDFANDPDREDRSFFMRMFSLGLSPKPPGFVPKTEWPSVGLFSPRVIVHDYAPSPPFEPIDRVQAGDLYWMAKRLAAIPQATLAQAVTAGELEPGPVNYLFQTLHIRRAAIVAYGYDQTTPCELVTLEPGNEEWAAVIADLAVQQRFVPPKERSYELTFFDAEGNEIAEPRIVQASASIVRLPLPRALRDHGYSVMRVWGRRNDAALPRPFDIHFRPGDGGLTVAGLRH